MWPIKWKEILYRITIWNQKMSQYNSLESALQIGLIFFYFEDYSKSARGMILFLLVTCSYIPILLKNAEKPTVIWLSTENFFKSTVHISFSLTFMTDFFWSFELKIIFEIFIFYFHFSYFFHLFIFHFYLFLLLFFLLFIFHV